MKLAKMYYAQIRHKTQQIIQELMNLRLAR
jgi:hypothetical protein